MTSRRTNRGGAGLRVADRPPSDREIGGGALHFPEVPGKNAPLVDHCFKKPHLKAPGNNFTQARMGKKAPISRNKLTDRVALKIILHIGQGGVRGGIGRKEKATKEVSIR